MPRHDRDPLSTPRPGPYEASYSVLRGYDAPPPQPARTPDRRPVLVAARGEPRPD